MPRGRFFFSPALRPGRAALADIAWPADDARRQALILFAVPMVLPALVNLVVPARLTPDWTFPNWALLPVVLYGSRKIAVDSLAVAGAGLVALAVRRMLRACFTVHRLRAPDGGPRFQSAELAGSRRARRKDSRQTGAALLGFAGDHRELAILSGRHAIGSQTIRCPTSAGPRLRHRALSSPVSTTIRRAWPPKPRLPAPAFATADWHDQPQLSGLFRQADRLPRHVVPAPR